MKSEMVEKDTVPERAFPKLQIEVPTGIVYLMKHSERGTTINIPKGRSLALGESIGLFTPDMKDFDGDIILGND